MILTAIFTPADEGGYVAFNPETGTTSQGETIPEATQNLAEATEVYLAEFPLTQTSRSLMTTFELLENA
jgi:predicted RNase H-like HicB family nuclease